MKRNNAIIIGILILIAAVGLLFYAFNPGLQVFTVPVWKWILAAALLYWLIKKVVFGREIANKLSVFIPLALGFMLFEREIGTAVGKGPDFVNNWLIILAAVMLDIAVWAIFRPRHKKFFSQCRKDMKDNVKEKVTFGSEDSNGSATTFKLGSHIYYVDAAVQKTADLINQLGELNVYYQNTDMVGEGEDFYLNLVNQMGETSVHIPRDWHADISNDNTMGSVNCRNDVEETVHTIHIRVRNQMGEVNVVSDD
ncbi:MAG: hypothetical protein K6B54_06285 [Clostridia bacterium]|nr:hypothetical protein [Clostridia bacterium]